MIHAPVTICHHPDCNRVIRDDAMLCDEHFFKASPRIRRLVVMNERSLDARINDTLRINEKATPKP